MTVTGLPQGIERKVPYIPGEELQCILDGAIYVIPVQNKTTSGITTTLLKRQKYHNNNTVFDNVTRNHNNTVPDNVTKYLHNSNTAPDNVTTYHMDNNTVPDNVTL